MRGLPVGILRVERGRLGSADIVLKIVARLLLLQPGTHHIEAAAHTFRKLVVAHLDDVVHIFDFNIQQPDKGDCHQYSE